MTVSYVAAHSFTMSHKDLLYNSCALFSDGRVARYISGYIPSSYSLATCGHYCLSNLLLCARSENIVESTLRCHVSEQSQIEGTRRWTCLRYKQIDRGVVPTARDDNTIRVFSLGWPKIKHTDGIVVTHSDELVGG